MRSTCVYYTCTHLYSMLFQAPPLPPLCHLHYLEDPIMTIESNKYQLVSYIYITYSVFLNGVFF